MNSTNKTNRSRLAWIAGIAAAFVLTLALVIFLAPAEAAEVNTNNMASSYTTYSYYYNNWTAKPLYSYKDVWNSSYTTLRNSLNNKWQFVDSWQGPTVMTRTESLTTGTSRTTSFSGEASYKSYVKATIGYSYTNSSSKTVSKQFEFPGDNRLHTLYVSRRHIDRDNYTWRTSYRANPKSYSWIWGVASWNVKWGTYSRYSARDVAKYKSASTTEYQYGNYMT